MNYQPPRKQESLGPWILAAAVAHALFLVLGFTVALEYQKYLAQQSIKQIINENKNK